MAAHTPPNTVQADRIFLKVEIDPGAYLSRDRMRVPTAWEIAAATVPAFGNVGGEFISSQLKAKGILILGVETVPVHSQGEVSRFSAYIQNGNAALRCIDSIILQGISLLGRCEALVECVYVYYAASECERPDVDSQLWW